MNKLKYLDDEEKELIKSLEKGEWVSDFNKSIKKEYHEHAKQSLSKQKRINIRMTERDLKKIQVKALQVLQIVFQGMVVTKGIFMSTEILLVFAII